MCIAELTRQTAYNKNSGLIQFLKSFITKVPECKAKICVAMYSLVMSLCLHDFITIQVCRFDLQQSVWFFDGGTSTCAYI